MRPLRFMAPEFVDCLIQDAEVLMSALVDVPATLVSSHDSLILIYLHSELLPRRSCALFTTEAVARATLLCFALVLQSEKGV